MFYFDRSQMPLFGKPVTYYAVIPILAAVVLTGVCCWFTHRRRGNVSLVFRVCLTFFLLAAAGQLFTGYIPAAMRPFSVFLSVLGVMAVFAIVGKLAGCVDLMLQVGVMGCAIYLGLSKLGCFFTGCCYGRPYAGPFSVTYGAASFCAVRNIPLFPAQLITAFLLLAVAAAAFCVFSKPRRRFTVFMLAGCICVVYYGCVSLCDVSANQMYLAGIDFSIVLAALSLLCIAACWAIGRKKQNWRETNP